MLYYYLLSLSQQRPKPQHYKEIKFSFHTLLTHTKHRDKLDSVAINEALSTQESTKEINKKLLTSIASPAKM